MTEPERRRRVRALLPSLKDRIRLNQPIFIRAQQLVKLGFKPADALHVASVEGSGAAIMLTCDDRVCRLASRLEKKLSVRIMNPVQWVQES